MKAIFVAACGLSLLLLTSAASDWDVRSAELVQTINSGNHGWTAEESPRFKGMTIEQVKQMMGCGDTDIAASLKDVPMAEAVNQTVVESLPKEFDASTAWPAGCIHGIRDQGNCGSCWAFSISESLTDRACAGTGGSINVVLSPQHLVTCASAAWAGANGCAGGYLVQGWAFTQNPGLVTEGCIPYSSGGGAVPACAYTGCADGSPVTFYRSISGSTQQMPNVASIQSSISTYGPVSACFTVYEDFVNYKSGVYHHTSGGNLGGHCVKITGWGSNYWIVANSWGTGWGMSGWFYISMGNNECGIESSVIVARVV